MRPLEIPACTLGILWILPICPGFLPAMPLKTAEVVPPLGQAGLPLHKEALGFCLLAFEPHGFLFFWDWSSLAFVAG